MRPGPLNLNLESIQPTSIHPPDTRALGSSDIRPAEPSVFCAHCYAFRQVASQYSILLNDPTPAPSTCGSHTLTPHYPPPGPGSARLSSLSQASGPGRRVCTVRMRSGAEPPSRASDTPELRPRRTCPREDVRMAPSHLRGPTSTRPTSWHPTRPVVAWFLTSDSEFGAKASQCHQASDCLKWTSEYHNRSARIPRARVPHRQLTEGGVVCDVDTCHCRRSRQD